LIASSIRRPSSISNVIPDAQFSAQALNQSFEAFLAPDADRYLLLKALLEKLRLSYEVLSVCGNRHFLIAPGNVSRARVRSALILVAHYDRVVGSPGANDNSAAVFELLDAAISLREERINGWLIIFTDKEELTHGERLIDQGSYSLVKELRASGLGRPEVFIFDACGSGDTLIISTTAEHLLKNESRDGGARARNLLRQLRSRALETTRRLHMKRVCLIPTPFSDDAGFLRAGLAAQTITVLPADEAAAFATLLRNTPAYTDALFKHDAPNLDQSLIPQTWRRLNGPDDTRPYLTPQHFSEVTRFIRGLCE
jgi:hypothetical protein